MLLLGFLTKVLLLISGQNPLDLLILLNSKEMEKLLKVMLLTSFLKDLKTKKVN